MLKLYTVNIAAEKNLDGIISDFKLVIDVSNHSKNLMRALTAPIYNLETKFELLDNIFKAYPTNDILIRFLKILVKNNQIKYLNEIYQKSLQYILNGKGIEKAYLTSARPMNPEELKKTISILDNHT
ncbi:MAG UNVERIFIED_CONTAM: F0F1 ATP synthase subunit delta [Rickettsiaceae bacterium]|jgi:F0F1-type ATP synthase delta subunit